MKTNVRKSILSVAFVVAICSVCLTANANPLLKTGNPVAASDTGKMSKMSKPVKKKKTSKMSKDKMSKDTSKMSKM